MAILVGNLLVVGDTFNPVVATDTVFYVEGRTGSGTAGCLRITELDPNDILGSDFLEIQNISGAGFDATGYQVYASDNSSNINATSANIWNLGYFNPGEVQYKTDNSSDIAHYWGSNLAWNGGTLGGWAMIVDNNHNVVDYAVWAFDSTAIQSQYLVIAGDTVRVGSEWSGNGYVSCVSPNSNQRIGSDDHNNASDFSCDVTSQGIQNTNMSSVFPNCGIGACGSSRIPVMVHLYPD